MFQAFLIKYGEIGIKGKNRHLFEDALMKQIRHALKPVEGKFFVRKEQGRIFVETESAFDYDEVIVALQRVFGIVGICPMVQAADEGFDKLAERIYQYSEVNAVYLMSGAYDFTVFIEGKTMRQVAQFVSDKLAPLDSVLSTATHFVLKKYKDHGTVLCDEVQDERMLITP